MLTFVSMTMCLNLGAGSATPCSKIGQPPTKPLDSPRRLRIIPYGGARRNLLMSALVGGMTMMRSRSRRTLSMAMFAVALVGILTTAVVYPSRWHRHHRTPWNVTGAALSWSDGLWLQPGQYLWAGDAGPAGPARIVVDLDHHRAYVYQNGALIGISTISAGRRGHGTPTGSYPILQKAVYHRSNIYSNAPMPYMQRLTWGGIALHAGHFSGYNQSHGCIRLPWSFAKLLFSVTSLGGQVDVVRSWNPGALPPIQTAAIPSTAEAVAQMVSLSL
jgi:hypothetical protein